VYFTGRQKLNIFTESDKDQYNIMSAPLNQFTKDLYKLLHLPRTATQTEIKQSYRKIALALHPDRHDGCDVKTAEFKEVSEAYRILSDYTKRIEYDRWLDGVSLDSDGRIIRRRGTSSSRAAERNPYYRKVYSPAAPPGMKTFDRQRHFDMHYGDGIMNEEIERARKRAEAASPRKSGYSYQSPLGAGFYFDMGRPMNQQMNPYSRRGSRQHDHLNNSNATGGNRIEYEEAYFEMNTSQLSEARRVMSSKQHVVERMNDRRKNRVRERGDPNPYQERRKKRLDDGHEVTSLTSAAESGCIVM
jgi:curved DNA-binding protein CbpA